MADQDPLSDFIEQLKREANRMVEESNELDIAIRRGRIGDLIKKYNPRHQTPETNNGDDDPGEELEGETGGPEIQDSDST